MGIQGLLPFLKPSSRPVNLSEFSGQIAAVDTYCWIHKGAFSCADKLVLGETTDRYVLYVMKQVNMLLSFNIKPILVFDGCHLPAKAHTESKRRENRATNKAKAKEFLREGKIKEARECFQRCLDVTSEMAHEVIKACRAKNVDIIVAPYEADAQLAYLNQCGIADIIITEDSDLVLFGCNKIVYKIDSNGGGNLVEKEKLHLSMKVPRDKFSFEKFSNMCILSGCDYLPSLKGIGLVKACRFFNVTSNPDVFNALCKIPSHLKMPSLEVPLEYREGFIRARNTVLYQLVFDPLSRTLKPLTPYCDGHDHSNYPYSGEFVGHEKALQIALGNINVQTGKQIDYFDPDKHKFRQTPSSNWSSKNVCVYPSIWARGASFKKENLIPTSNLKSEMFGKEVIVKVKLKNNKRKVDDDMISEDDLQSMYANSKPSPKKIKSEEETTITEDQVVETNGTKIDVEYSSLCQEEDKLNLVEVSSPNKIKKLEISPDKEIKTCNFNPFTKSASKVSVEPIKSAFSLRTTTGTSSQSIKSHIVVHSRYFSPQLSKSTTKHSPDTPQRSTSNLFQCNKLRNSFKSSCNAFKWKTDNWRVSEEKPREISSESRTIIESIFDTPPQSQNKENSPLHNSEQSTNLILEHKFQVKSTSPVFHRKLSTITASPVVKNTTKCRASGLKKSSVPKQKQLSIRDMLSFKK